MVFLSFAVSVSFTFFFHFVHFVVDDKVLCCFARRHIILFDTTPATAQDRRPKQYRCSKCGDGKDDDDDVEMLNWQCTHHLYILYTQYDVNSFLLIYCCIANAWENMKPNLLQIRHTAPTNVEQNEETSSDNNAHTKNIYVICRFEFGRAAERRRRRPNQTNSSNYTPNAIYLDFFALLFVPLAPCPVQRFLFCFVLLLLLLLSWWSLTLLTRWICLFVCLNVSIALHTDTLL